MGSRHNAPWSSPAQLPPGESKYPAFPKEWSRRILSAVPSPLHHSSPRTTPTVLHGSNPHGFEAAPSQLLPSSSSRPRLGRRRPRASGDQVHRQPYLGRRRAPAPSDQGIGVLVLWRQYMVAGNYVLFLKMA